MSTAAAIWLGGCVAILESDGARTDVDVRVPQGTIIAELSMLTDFRVPVNITNMGPNYVIYDPWCGWRIEQSINGQWAPAYYPLCSPIAQELHAIQPGATFYESLPAHRSWRVGNGAGVEGTYRVVYEMFEETALDRHVQIREERTASNAFLVRR